MTERDMIDELALIAWPEPRHGEVDPPEAFDDAVDDTRQRRQAYADNLRAQVDDTGEDPLLAALRAVAGRRGQAEQHQKALIAYGRHCTGARPDYTWEALAQAAGLPYSTTRKTINQVDVDRVREILDDPARRWPTVVSSLDVHRAYDQLKQFDFPDVPEGLDHEAEYRWWKTTKVPQLEDTDQRRLARRVIIAADGWHNRWLRVAYPRAPRYHALARQLIEIAARQHHWDPAQRHVPDETARLDAILDELADLRDQAAADRAEPSTAER